ncbi:MAG TPA: DUF3570 domain-containing protein [Gammaproteobacteria bacterium]|nr:DUF3570 domain-containing protein [Gammaproteobacteria bacterium]
MLRHPAIAFVALAALPSAVFAGVLPEDRADVLYHSYDGGGVTIDGPSILVRKQFAGKFSAAANYYVDNVSSASIDVVTTASPYEEERTQYSLGLDYLRDRWILNLGFASSTENDFDAETFSIGVSQDLFGDLTTISLGYSLGDDIVTRRGDANFSDTIKRQHYRVGLSQILTQNLLLGFSFETITDEGFLNNPYRSVRYLDDSSPAGYSYEPEVYPRTRTSDAAAIRLRYYLPYRAALHLEYRAYTDTWDILSDTFEMGYTHPLGDGLTIEAKVRGYAQGSAEFYRDLFPYEQYANFIARDKELSTFSSTTFRLGVSYKILGDGWRFIERGSVNFVWDHIFFDYKDFRDLRPSGLTPGTEPLYGFDADVVQIFVSFWL